LFAFLWLSGLCFLGLWVSDLDFYFESYFLVILPTFDGLVSGGVLVGWDTIFAEIEVVGVLFLVRLWAGFERMLGRVSCGVFGGWGKVV